VKQENNMSGTKVITNIGQLITFNPSFYKEEPITDTVEPDLGLIQDAAVLVEDGYIKWVGPEEEVGWDWLDKYDVVNARKNVVTPGLIDSHNHLIFAGSRHNEFEMRLQGISYTDIAKKGGGILSTVEPTRKASFEDLYHTGLERVRRIQSFGVTTMEAKTGYGLSLESEIKMLKVIKALNNAAQADIIPTFMGAHALAPEFKDYESYTDYICKEMIPAVAQQKLAKFCDVFAERNYFSIEQARRILYTASEYGLLLKLHGDEFSNFYATALALEVGATSVDHLICMDNAAMEPLANSDTVATVMPGVSLFLGTGTAPAREMLNAGVKVALATDFNPGSNMCECLPLAMVYGCLLLKMSPAEVLKAVTVNAAKALALDDRGSIEVGKRADFAFFDISSYQYMFYHYGINHLSRLMVMGENVLI
jgi:imidazolonepropionase